MNNNSTPQEKSVGEQTLVELRKITKILTLANGPALERELNKYMTTKERKKIWINIDGKRMPGQIANDAGLKIRAVEILIRTLTEAGLIEPRQYGEPPRRSIDYVPVTWLEAVTAKAEDTQVPLPMAEAASDSPKEAPTGGITDG